MEKWKEVFVGIIPKAVYQVQLINGEKQGLTIKLSSSQTCVMINFGMVQAVRMLDEGIVQNLQIQPCIVGGADQQSTGGAIIRGAGRGAGELVAAGEGDAVPLRQLPVAGALVYQSAKLPVRFQSGAVYGHTCKGGGGILPPIAQQPAAAICPTILGGFCCNVCTYG